MLLWGARRKEKDRAGLVRLVQKNSVSVSGRVVKNIDRKGGESGV